MCNQKTIELNYSIHLDGKEELASIRGKPEDPKLDKLDKILLMKKPSLVNLSIGNFVLKSDFAESINNDLGGRYIKYEKVEVDYKKE